MVRSMSGDSCSGALAPFWPHEMPLTTPADRILSCSTRPAARSLMLRDLVAAARASTTPSSCNGCETNPATASSATRSYTPGLEHIRLPNASSLHRSAHCGHDMVLRTGCGSVDSGWAAVEVERGRVGWAKGCGVDRTRIRDQRISEKRFALKPGKPCLFLCT